MRDEKAKKLAIIWPSSFGTYYVALGVKCESEEECLKSIAEAKNLMEPLDSHPILTWSDYYKMFMLATRYSHEEEAVKEFSERLRAMGWEVRRREESLVDDDGTDDDSELSDA